MLFYIYQDLNYIGGGFSLNWIDKLERNYGRYAIKDLVKYIVIGTGFVFLTRILCGSEFIIDFIKLDPPKILRGQIWRLITFVFEPEVKNIFFILVLYVFYMFGKSLENYWGHFRFNLYYGIGAISAIAAGFISYYTLGGYGSIIYLNLSIFLAFAYLYPNMKLLLFFIIPVKVKYLAWFYLFFIGYSLIIESFPIKIAAILSFSNFIIFFGKDIMDKKLLPGVNKYNRERKKKKFTVVTTKKYEFVHKCRVCNKNSKDNPEEKFMYCPKCNSDFEYCKEHINNHDHIY